MDQFVPLTNDNIAELISNAKFQVGYTAPAMDINVANEVVQFARRTSLDQVAVTLDLSAEAYKDGFGDEGALDLLEIAGVSIKHVLGLRVGVLLVDDKKWTFSPASKFTPRSVMSQKKNSIPEEIRDRILDGRIHIPHVDEQVSLFAEHENDSMFEKALTQEQEETKSKERMKELKKELKEHLGPEFERQALISEYRSLIQFIEITFKGARLGQTTVKLPSELLNVTKKKGFEEKMKATYQLFNEDFSKFTKPLRDEVDAFREKYSRVLSKKYGRVMLTTSKKDFEIELQAINKKIEQYKIELNHQVNKQIQRTKQELIDYFTPVIMENPPEALFLGAEKILEENEVKSYIGWLLGREFPSSEQILKRIEFYHVVKGVTEDILMDKDFYIELERAFKDEPIYWPHQKYKQEELSL